jgi:hypothetical protein
MKSPFKPNGHLPPHPGRSESPLFRLPRPRPTQLSKSTIRVEDQSQPPPTIDDPQFSTLKKTMQTNIATKSHLAPTLRPILEAWTCENPKLSYFSNFTPTQISEISTLTLTELHKIKLLLTNLQSFQTSLLDYSTHMTSLKKMTNPKIRASQKPVIQRDQNPVNLFLPFYNPHNNPDFYRVSRST